MNGITIRAMRPDDAERVAELCGQLGYPSTLDEVKRRSKEIAGDKHHAFLVAEVPGRGLIAWIHLYLCNLMVDDLRTEIWGLVVDEAYRGRGIGKLLMEEAEELARGQGCKAVCLRSNVIRGEAHNFYENLGYGRIKTQHVFKKQL